MCGSYERGRSPVVGGALGFPVILPNPARKCWVWGSPQVGSGGVSGACRTESLDRIGMSCFSMRESDAKCDYRLWLARYNSVS